MVIYSKLLMRGICLWPLIILPEWARGDIAQVAHERRHYRQQSCLLPVWWVLYVASKRFRFYSEVEAYLDQAHIQMTQIPAEWSTEEKIFAWHHIIEFCATQLATLYWGCCTYQEAYRELTK